MCVHVCSVCMCVCVCYCVRACMRVCPYPLLASNTHAYFIFINVLVKYDL